MPSPLRKIAPALMQALGEPATFLSDSTGLTAVIRAIVNRDVQKVVLGATGWAVSERRTMLDLLRADLPTDPKIGDTVTLTETGEAFILKRKESDDGDLLTFVVQAVES